MTDTVDSHTPTRKGEDAKEGISDKILAVAADDQTALFTRLPVPLSELLGRQGIDGPQGLAAFADPEWELDDESERFLEAIFADSD